MLLFVLVLVTALIFEYINGFHDAANAIATVVSTKVLTPRQAILLAAFFNLLGGFMGTAVARTVGEGQVQIAAVTMVTVFSALLAAIIWNLVTWWFGLPSSSSHALIGGLSGAALATSNGDWSVLIWDKVVPGQANTGLWPKVVLPMAISPICGFVVGFLLMVLIALLFVNWRPSRVNDIFGRLQIISAAWMGLSHGTNDAQKTMGIIALALFTGTSAGVFSDLPPWLRFLQTPIFRIEYWVVAICAITMALGTAAGGWRIIRTMGHKIVRLQPVHGFAAETTAGAIIQVASQFGIPLSTTHVIATSIMGVGAMKRFGAVKWEIVGRIVWAWILTLPVTAAIGYLIGNTVPLIMPGG
jgi:PiT family inorganic phosphate transporter